MQCGGGERPGAGCTGIAGVGTMATVGGLSPPTSARNRLRARDAVQRDGAMWPFALDCGFPLAGAGERPHRSKVEEPGLVPGADIVAVLKVPAVHLVATG